jgi:hypothetical protein
MVKSPTCSCSAEIKISSALLAFIHADRQRRRPRKGERTPEESKSTSRQGHRANRSKFRADSGRFGGLLPSLLPWRFELRARGRWLRRNPWRRPPASPWPAASSAATSGRRAPPPGRSASASEVSPCLLNLEEEKSESLGAWVRFLFLS